MLERMKEASAKKFSTKRLRRHSRVEFLIQTFEVFLGLAYVADALPFRLTKCIVNHRLEEAHVIGKLLQVSLRLLSCGSFLPQSLTGPPWKISDFRSRMQCIRVPGGTLEVLLSDLRLRSGPHRSG